MVKCNMKKIPDRFNGYLRVNGNEFVYNVSDSVVTMLPAQSDKSKRWDVFQNTCSYKCELPEYLFGEYEGTQIAFLRKTEFSTRGLGLDLSIQFATPLIIKAAGNAVGYYGNLTEEWNKFHAITFYGGNINSLYMPQIAVEPTDMNQYFNNGARQVKIRPWKEYSHSIELNIDNEKVELTISVLQSGEMNDPIKLEAYNLGELNSYIRFSFENAQDSIKIIKYYKIVKSLVAILTKQNNVRFDVYLSQRNSTKQYFTTAYCKIFDRYENYSMKKTNRVIPLLSIWNGLPNLINKIAKNEAEILLTILPEDNKMVNKISISNIQDLCTALEVAYNWDSRTREKDEHITELKKAIKKSINEFIKNHPEIDVYTQTTVSSAFEYLSYTLKQKIITLYNENQSVIDLLISKRSLKEMSEENIAAFVKLRNGKTHSGVINWGNSAYLYPALLALLYVCFFRYIGLDEERIKVVIFNIL